MGRVSQAEEFQASEMGTVHIALRSSCVAGIDDKTGQDYSYRREWIRRRMESLASVFAIDVLTRVFPGRRLEEHLAEPTESDVQMLVNHPERLVVIRERLSDISWFMRALSEPIARMENRQDDCTGLFWQDRYHATVLTDEASLLACSAYVDLNPIRAAMCEKLEDSDHTSVQRRIESMREEEPNANREVSDSFLAPLSINEESDAVGPCVSAGSSRCSDKGFLAMSLEDYLLLLDWTARQSVAGKRGKTPACVSGLRRSFGVWRIARSDRP